MKITFKISFKTDFIYVCIGAHECRCLHSLEIKNLLELEIHTVVSYMADSIRWGRTSNCPLWMISLFSYFVVWWCMKIHIILSPVLYAKFGFSSMHFNMSFVEKLDCLTAHTAFHVPSLWRADIFHIFISHSFVSLLLTL